MTEERGKRKEERVERRERGARSEERGPEARWRWVRRSSIIHHSSSIIRRSGALALALAATLAGAAEAAAQQPASQGGTFLIRGGTVVARPGQVMQGASVLIRDGRIAAVGADVAAPAGATVVDATGRWVYPGMIDSSTPLGLYEIGSIVGTIDNRELGDFNPHLRAVASVNPHSELIPVTRVNGVTTAITQPTGGLVSGQAALIRLDGWTWEEMAIRPAAALVVQYPRAPRGFFGPATPEQERAAQERVEQQIRELRDFFRQSRDHARMRAGGAPAGALPLESMRAVFAGELPVLVLADSREQIEGALALADTFGVRVIIGGGEEAYRVRDELARRNVPVILGSMRSNPAFDAPYDALWAQPAVLQRAGVRFAFSTGEAANSRHLPYHAAKAVAFGLSPDEAWRALTLAPAEIWGVADRIGSIEVGKSADLFIATGDPLDVRTRVEQVWIAGKRIPLDDRHTRFYEQFRARPGP
jgi:imidazolonepropionase-like amidohydrolase